MKNFVKKHGILLAFLGMILLGNGWLIIKGLPYQHDIGFHYARMLSLIQTIKNGDFLALIHDAFYGYGYALGIFYGNFFFYFPALFTILGLPAMLSYKILYLFINIGTLLIAYYVSRKIIPSQKIALLLTFLYTFSEYRLYDVFVRGAIGETLSFMVVPLVLLGLYEIIYGDSKKWYYFTLGFVFLLVSHLITTIVMAIFASILFLFHIPRFVKEKKRFYHLVLSGIVGVCLAAFFLFPMLEQYFCSSISIFTQGSIYLPSGAATPIRYLFLPGWFFSCYLGLSILLLLPIRFLLSAKKVEKEDRNLLSFSTCLLILGVLIWLSTSDLFPWKIVDHMLSFLQFPWRLLLFSTLFCSFAIGINLFLLWKNGKQKLVKRLAIFILLTCFFGNALYSFQYGVRKEHYESFPENEIGNGEYLPSGTDQVLLRNLKPEVTSNNPNLEISYEKVGTSISVQYQNHSNDQKEDTYVEVPLLYYLGYQIEPNYHLTKGNHNLIRVGVDQEAGEFQISYQGTMIQKVSYLISLMSWILFLIYCWKRKKRKKNA